MNTDMMKVMMENCLTSDNSLELSIKAIANYDDFLTQNDYQQIYDLYCSENMLNLTEEMAFNTEIRKKINNYMAKRCDKVVKVHYRGKKGRMGGQCYNNAYEELEDTGNKMVYGFIIGNGFGNDYYTNLVPHCFNYDEKTNTYYDTTCFQLKENQIDRPAFLITDILMKTYKGDIQTHLPLPSPDITYGGYTFITYKNKMYVILGKEHGNHDTYPLHFKKMKVIAAL